MKLLKQAFSADPSFMARQALIDKFGSDEDGAADPYGGMPLYPGYLGLEDQKALVSGLSLNKAPGEAYIKEAMRTGPSKYAELAGKQQNLLSMEGANQAAKAAAGGTATARTNLAMRGGLTGGGAIALEKSGRDMGLEGRQKAMSDKAKNMLAIGQQDETNRLGMLAGAPGVALNEANYDITKSKAKGEISDKENAFNLARYNAQMQGWGANKQAEATANSGKK